MPNNTPLRWVTIGSMALSLAACVGAPASAPVRTTPVSTAPPMNTRGLEAVLNRTDRDLVRLFGEPRLDVREGQARKLQFSGQSCILDVYLYPGKNGGTQRSSYVDARNPQGASVDRVACVNALRR